METRSERGEADALVAELASELQRCLGDAIVGAYLYGSLAAGDFDPTLSDLDLLIALRDDVDDAQLADLGALHRGFEARHGGWAGRVDASYLAAAALQHCKEHELAIVVISPGEPLHRTRTSPGWLMNWHAVREQGVSLQGPDPSNLIPRIRHEDFLAAVRVHMQEMPGRTSASTDPRFHAHAVLTGCRALFSAYEAGQASKPQAAAWARQRQPEWARLVDDALALRRRLGRDPSPDFRDEAVAFLEFVQAAIVEPSQA